MTSWANVPLIDVLNRIIHLDIFFDDGKIKPKANPVWKEICSIWKLPSCDNKDSCEIHLSCHDEEINVGESKNLITSINQDLSSHIEDLIEKARNGLDSDKSLNYDDVNPYFLPDVLNDLKSLFKKFPAWTNVMLKYYDSKHCVTTSSRSENYFKFVKDYVLTDRQPCRADMFIVEHLKTIKSKIIEGRAAYDKEKVMKKEVSIPKNNKKVDQCVLNFLENWKNQVKAEESVELDFVNTENDSDELNKCDVGNNDEQPCLPEEPLKFNFTDDQIFSDEINVNECKNKKSDIDYLKVDKESSLSLSDVDSPNFYSTPKNNSSNNDSKISLRKNSEHSFSIIFDPEPIDFKIINEKRPVQQENIPTDVPRQAVKRGKYLTPFPEVQVLHQKAADKKPKRKKKGNNKEWLYVSSLYN